ncbi:hypothetical protein C8F01DRAFT_1231209 [Mycena amicta]|nr:hypothetical protein C8F01DRAFT_1231209 [Mycena amicta]
MFASKVLFLLAASAVTFALATTEGARVEKNATASIVGPPQPNIIPVSFTGVVAAIQATAAGDDTRIYFQNSANGIEEFAISGPLNSGVRYGFGELVPGTQIRSSSPIAAVSVDTTVFRQIRLYFVSPLNILSEYIYDAVGATWRGGPSCADCIDRQHVDIWPGSQVLYALTDGVTTTNARVRVGFITTELPDTLSEMIWTPLAGWQFAQLN